MPGENVVGRPFQSSGWHPAVKTQLRKARNTVPLEHKITTILNAGPFLHNCRVLFAESTVVISPGHKYWIGIVPAETLTAVVRWDLRDFIIMSVIDLEWLLHRPQRREWNIYRDRQVQVRVFIDQQNRIVCTKASAELFRYEPLASTSKINGLTG